MNALAIRMQQAEKEILGIEKDADRIGNETGQIRTETEPDFGTSFP